MHPLRTATVTAAIALILTVAAAAPAAASGSDRDRIGTHCQVARHKVWTVNICPTIHVREDRIGNLQARAAAAAAGYGPGGTRRPMLLAMRVRLVGDPHLARAFPYTTRRRVLRGPWLVASGDLQTRVLVYVRWPSGEWTQHLVYSHVVNVGS